MRGRMAPTTIGIRSPCGSVVRKPCERTCSPARSSFSPSRACRRAGRNSFTYGSGGANSRAVPALDHRRAGDADAGDHPARGERGERLEPHREQPHRPGRHRHDAGADRDVLRRARDGGEQREDVRAGHLAGDDGVVAAALGLPREPDELLRSAAPPRPGSRRRRASLSDPRIAAAAARGTPRRPPCDPAVVKSSAVASSVSARPCAGVAVDELLARPGRRSAGLSAIRPATASASSSSCVVRHDRLDEADLERLLGVDHVRGEREPARPVAADHLGAADEAEARLEPDPRLAEGERRAVGRDHDVAEEDDLGAAAEGDAVDGGDHGQLGPLDRVERVGDEAQLAAVGGEVGQLVEGGDVAAGRERVAGAREDDGAHVALAVEVLEHARAARGRTSGSSRSSSRAGSSRPRPRRPCARCGIPRSPPASRPVRASRTSLTAKRLVEE